MRSDSSRRQTVGSERIEFRRIAPCLYYLLIEFGRPMAWVPALAPLKLGLVAGVIGLTAISVQRTRRWPRPLWYILGFLPLMAWHVTIAVNNRIALWALENFAILFTCLLPLALLPRTIRSMKAILASYVLLHVPTSIYALLHGGRGMGGWMGDENDLALALNIAIGIGVYLLLLARRPLHRAVVIAALGVMGAGVVASLSRGGVIGLASVTAFLLLTGPRRKVVATVATIGLLGIWLLAPPSFWTEVRSIETATQPGDTGEQRLYLWGIAWRMFLDHPLTGVGAMNYGINAALYEDQERAETTGFHVWGRVAHSVYFTLLAEQGLIGTMLFGALLVWCYRTIRRLRRRSRSPDGEETALLASGLAAGCAAYLATGAFLSVLYYPLFWVLVAMLAALDAIDAEREKGSG